MAAADAEPDSTGVQGVVRRLGKWRSRYATARVMPTAAKLFEDGVIEAGTAALLAPYLDRTGDAGKPIYPQPVLDSLAKALNRDGWQVHVHAIGDRAIRMTLNAFEHARSVNAPGMHAIRSPSSNSSNPADLPRFRRLGVIANFEPFGANGEVMRTILEGRTVFRPR